MSEPKFTRTFEFHGITLSKLGSQYRGDCLLCGKDRHFYVNPETGQWDCKSCGEKGNVFTFLEKLYQLSCSEYDSAHKRNGKKPTQLDKLAKLRRLPNTSFRKYGLVPACYDDTRILLPIRNFDGGFSSLKVYDLSAPVKRRKWLNTSECSAHLWRIELLKSLPLSVPVYLCEGEWDCLALEYLRSKLEKPGLILAVPGSSTFKETWTSFFQDRIVYLLYDNDLPGEKGMDSVTLKIGSVVKELHRIHWPKPDGEKEIIPEGYDINEFVADNLKTPKRAWSTLLEMCPVVKTVQTKSSSNESSKIPPSTNGKDSSPEKVVNLKPISFNTFRKVYRNKLHANKNIEDALAIMFATVLSTKLTHDPLWVFMVAAAGGGKTLMLRSLELCENCIFQSTLTPHCLISGFVPPDGSDLSLLPLLEGKTLIVKDYTAIKSLPSGIQEEIYGILRDAYDGKVSKPFGHIGIKTYESHFSMLAGVTHIIHGDNRATLGERFLKFELLRDHRSETHTDHIRSALESVNKFAKIESQIRELAVRFFLNEFDPDKAPKVPKWATERIIHLAQIVGTLRTNVDRKHTGELISRPRAEIATRIAKQLQKLSIALAWVFGKRVVDKNSFRIVEQVALDTAYGWTSDVFRTLVEAAKPLKLYEISVRSRIAESTVQRKLEDLIELGVVSAKLLETERPGNPPKLYSITPHVQNLWRRSRITSISSQRDAPKVRKFSKRRRRIKAKA